MTQLSNAEIIIIGGGAVGCGVAYALARAGKTNILLLERAKDVGQVTTAQGAAGFVNGAGEIDLAKPGIVVRGRSVEERFSPVHAGLTPERVCNVQLIGPLDASIGKCAQSFAIGRVQSLGRQRENGVAPRIAPEA